jgi:tripartite-type tricarboxylate transporter receptor subunit TctC
MSLPGHSPQSLEKILGNPSSFENKPGAGAKLGGRDTSANSKPDGYTLFLMMVGTQAINEYL